MDRTVAVKTVYGVSLLVVVAIFVVNSNENNELEPFMPETSGTASKKPKNIIANLSEPDVVDPNFISRISSVKTKVIAFSLFGNASDATWRKRFFEPMKNNSEFAAAYYPGWVIRIYHNFTENATTELRAVNVQFVNVLELKIGNNTGFGWVNPRVWRFLVLLDPQVDVVSFRDSDALMLQREVDAVDVWLNSTKTFHVMRDYKTHSNVILAGMFGVKIHQKRLKIQALTSAMIARSKDEIKETDQLLLKNIFWKEVRADCIVHDSFFCASQRLAVTKGSLILPFPTERVNGSFVGNVVGKSSRVTVVCPEECRPQNNKDWLYC